MPTYYLGLDVHKVRTQYCLMDPAGEILAEGSLPTEEVATVVPADCAVVLEATGSWHHTYDALCACAEVEKATFLADVQCRVRSVWTRFPAQVGMAGTDGKSWYLYSYYDVKPDNYLIRAHFGGTNYNVTGASSPQRIVVR